jgi:glycosyltransferase involved in cell wall biosynthesis
MIPCNHEYINNLKKNITDINIKVRTLKPFHYSAPVNIIKILLFRLIGYKIIYVHWLYIFPFIWVMKLFCLYCHFLGYKIIWEMHNIISHNGTFKDLKMSKWFYGNCDGIIFHSYDDISRTKQTLNVEKKSLNTVIHLPNFIGTYENNIDKNHARSVLNIPPDKRVLLCFGQIRKNRGYDYLIKAIDGMNNILVIIAGEIIDRDTYKFLLSQAKKDIRIKLSAKWISNEEIQIYFNACDVVILPYTEITTSGVVPLAYSFSRPVIVSRIGGIKEVVSKETGILVPPCNVNKLRIAIIDIFKMDYMRMGENAYKYANEKLAWSKASEKIRNLISNML